MPRLTFTIAMPQPHTHLFEVAVTLRDAPADTTFRMPAWTPGSYLIREYCRHVQDVSAVGADGAALVCEHVAKAEWVVRQPAPGAITLRYRVYAHDLTVRTSHLTGTHGYFNGANVFMCPEGFADERAILEVQPFGNWGVSVALPAAPTTPVPDFPAFRYAVESFDQLVDSPVECGTHREIHFEAAGVNHRWAVWGPGAEQWHTERGARALADVAAMIETEVALFGDLPESVEDYLFIVHLLPTRGGGLEHKNSQTLGVASDALKDPVAYEDFLTLVAHEYFHIWNVKRIRVQGLGPFDYSKEAYTPLLWMMEGITAFYDTMIPARTGLIEPKRYLEILGEKLATCRSYPGRHIRSLEESSFDAWVKLYRPDENTRNTAVSYYLKGELAIMCLDLHIRHATQGARSFDDIMRTLWVRQKETGAAIAPGDVVGLFKDATGLDLSEQLTAWVGGHEDLPLEGYLAQAGLKVSPTWKKQHPAHSLELTQAETPAPWMGLLTKQDNGNTVIATVRSDGPAAGANIYPGDELVAIDGRRVVGGDWGDRLKVFEPGDVVRVLLFRRRTQVEAEVTLGARPVDKFVIGMPAGGPTEVTLAEMRGWFGGFAESLWQTDPAA